MLHYYSKKKKTKKKLRTGKALWPNVMVGMECVDIGKETAETVCGCNGV